MTSTTENPSLTVTRTFNASREAVFHAWTDPIALGKWFRPNPAFETPEAEVDLRVGGSYRFTMQAPDGEQFKGFGTYREIEPPRKLVFTWNWEDSVIEPTETLVTLELRDLGGKTELTLRHEGFSSENAREQHGHGWAGCLDNLQTLLEAS